MLDCFEAGAVTLASGVASPACLVAERGAYSLADWLTRMERNPSAARQKSTLRQLLEAVTYLHGRGMVRPSGTVTEPRHDNQVRTWTVHITVQRGARGLWAVAAC